MRLNKFISNSGLCSRRKADDLIFSGEISIDGEICKNPATQVFEADKVRYKNKLIKNLEEKIYIAINKPRGFICTLYDEHAEKTLPDLLPEELKKLKPAGRLDKNTTGLVIMSNDGDFIQKLTHPKQKIDKEYWVKSQKPLTSGNIKKLKDGIFLDDGRKTAPAKITEIKNNAFHITIHEGRKRQIRLMCDFIRNPVLELRRVRINNIFLDNLPLGKFRFLKEDEIESILNAE